MHLIDYRVLDSNDSEVVLQYQCRPASYHYGAWQTEQESFDLELQRIERSIASAKELEPAASSFSSRMRSLGVNTGSRMKPM
ncbi:MAG: hypothetical protein AAF664_13395, partial [Planctomycetota bacterium]